MQQEKVLIGNSQHIKLLELQILLVTMDPSDLKAFFEGLAHNRSIECLEIYIQFVDETDDHFDDMSKSLELCFPSFNSTTTSRSLT